MSETGKEVLHNYFEHLADNRDRWRKRNRFYHRTLEKQFRMIIPEGSSVLEIGCGTGDLLNSVKPGVGYGIDFSLGMIKKARIKYPGLSFYHADAVNFKSDIRFDYVIMSDLLSALWDIQEVIKNLRNLIHPRTKVIIASYNYIWEPILHFGEFIGLKARQPLQSWLTISDIRGLLNLEEFEIVKVDRKLLLPIYIPVINLIFNIFLANLPGFNSFCLINLITARPVYRKKEQYSVSIVVPARNEKGNIENAIMRTPVFGSHQEFIFIEGNSSDHTWEEILRVRDAYPDKDIKGTVM